MAVVHGALMLEEPVQPTFVIGGAIVLLGVYIGAVYRPRRMAEVVVPPEDALPDGRRCEARRQISGVR